MSKPGEIRQSEINKRRITTKKRRLKIERMRWCDDIRHFQQQYSRRWKIEFSFGALVVLSRDDDADASLVNNTVFSSTHTHTHLQSIITKSLSCTCSWHVKYRLKMKYFFFRDQIEIRITQSQAKEEN